MDKDQADEFAGQGGSYVVGKDGKRQLVERTGPAGPQDQTQAAAPEPAAPADAKPASKTLKK